MGLLLRGLLRFWKPIATGVGSIMAWESVDEAVSPEAEQKQTSGMLVLVSFLLLFILGLLSGLIQINSKKKRR